MDKPTLSIVIPIHDMKGGDKFLWRSINALMEQTFQDFEIVITKQGLMAPNTNAGILKARGEYIKILYLDDYLAHRDALKDIVNAFEDDNDAEWLITAADNNLHPRYTDNIHTGNNKLGSPSALTIRNRGPLMLFDENMTWLLDCDYYRRMYEAYGPPIILDNKVGVNLGVGDHQVTHLLTDEEKLSEEVYMKTKYEEKPEEI